MDSHSIVTVKNQISMGFNLFSGHCIIHHNGLLTIEKSTFWSNALEYYHYSQLNLNPIN